jgi:molybdate transport system ATP-binding protein
MTLSVDIAIDAIDVRFEVPPGITVLFGPSGAGKSRTLSCIAGIARPERGRIALGAEVWFDPRTEKPIHERRVAYVFQSLALFPHLTALQNVAYGVSRGRGRAAREAHAEAMLAKMHVPHLRDRKPKTFSGGEAQRVALARAFAMHPKVVLLDEPFSALDDEIRRELLREVEERIAEAAIPTVLVTHRKDEALQLGQRIVCIEKGRVVREGVLTPTFFNGDGRDSGSNTT